VAHHREYSIYHARESNGKKPDSEGIYERLCGGDEGESSKDCSGKEIFSLDIEEAAE